MRVKCEYCGSYIEDTDEVCPHCGATNTQYQREAPREPRTIEELRSWYIGHNLPPEEVTRFFIGKNIKEPKAFGIYEEDGRFIVYKNKADGQRAVRYDGADEAYAVNELYQRLKEEISNQKAHQRNQTGQTSAKKKRKKSSKNSSEVIGIICIVVMFILMINSFVATIFSHNGYYKYNDDIYYLDNKSWYLYDDTDDAWHYYSYNQPFEEDYRDYSISKSDGKSQVGENFEDSSWYEDSSSDSSWSSNDWDSGSSWDSDSSWSSDSTDWSSDW